jgi:hypothetical protein
MKTHTHLFRECLQGHHTHCPGRQRENDPRTKDLNRRFPYAGETARGRCNCPCHTKKEDTKP